ncbi:hypothetical protein F5Y14DRAFT_367861 [Nemania sp. NC0429]|nr:hypothetical protein F5Y14DRAFT_367861 [Nemania sp. NC0429]
MKLSTATLSLVAAVASGVLGNPVAAPAPAAGGPVACVVGSGPALGAFCTDSQKDEVWCSNDCRSTYRCVNRSLQSTFPYTCPPGTNCYTSGFNTQVYCQ